MAANSSPAAVGGSRSLSLRPSAETLSEYYLTLIRGLTLLPPSGYQAGTELVDEGFCQEVLLHSSSGVVMPLDPLIIGDAFKSKSVILYHYTKGSVLSCVDQSKALWISVLKEEQQSGVLPREESLSQWPPDHFGSKEAIRATFPSVAEPNLPFGGKPSYDCCVPIVVPFNSSLCRVALDEREAVCEQAGIEQADSLEPVNVERWSVEELVSRLAADGADPAERLRAINRIGKGAISGNVQATAEVMRCMEHENESIRWASLTALGKGVIPGDTEVLQIIRQRLSHENASIRSTAARAMAKVALPEDEEARKLIEECLQDEDHRVRWNAEEALKEMAWPKDTYYAMSMAREGASNAITAAFGYESTAPLKSSNAIIGDDCFSPMSTKTITHSPRSNAEAIASAFRSPSEIALMTAAARTMERDSNAMTNAVREKQPSPGRLVRFSSPVASVTSTPEIDSANSSGDFAPALSAAEATAANEPVESTLAQNVQDHGRHGESFAERVVAQVRGYAQLASEIPSIFSALMPRCECGGQYAEELKQLAEMGFTDRSACITALENHGGLVNFNMVTDLIELTNERERSNSPSELTS